MFELLLIILSHRSSDLVERKHVLKSGDEDGKKEVKHVLKTKKYTVHCPEA